MNKVVHLIAKDALLEWRNKASLGGAVIYLLTVIFICLHAFDVINPDTWIALFWIVLLFTIINTVGRSFDLESSSSYLYHYHLISPRQLIVSKLLFNGIVAAIMALLAYVVFSLLLGNQLVDKVFFIFTLLLGSIGLSSTFTLMAAITSRSDGNLILMAILSLPIAIPLLILLVQLSERSFSEYSNTDSLYLLLALLLVNLLVSVLSVVLFPYLWRD